MNLINKNIIYLIGAGGIGMSALGRYFNSRGKMVFGYDRRESDLTSSLIEEGINLHFKDNESLIPEEVKSQSSSVLVIYTPAVPSDSEELSFFRNKGYDVLKRSEVLGLISSEYTTIAVAGTHGKTTTSSMIIHLLKSAGKSCIGFMGGVTRNFNSNFLMDENAEFLVTEADEYDRSFLTLHPDKAVITSVDPDHLDVYKNNESMLEAYKQFASQVKEKGDLLIHASVFDEFRENTADCLSYSIKEKADITASNIRVENSQYHFDFTHGDVKIENLSCGLPGRHNVENAVAALAIVSRLGVKNRDLKKGLKGYLGVKRRFEYHIKTDELVYIDDYAHHPEEIRQCVQSARELFPGKKLTGIFQPHLYSRTRDFEDDFAVSLGLFDELILLDIYPAREEPIEGVTSALLLEKVEKEDKKLMDRDELLIHLEKEKPEVVMTLGAGDIDRLVEPIKEKLKKHTEIYKLN